MSRTLACRLNFSEGRDPDKLSSILDSLKRTDDARVVRWMADADKNRSSFTLAGEPQAVLELAISSTEKALELIDMTDHQGQHPRIGAVDVVVFMPMIDLYLRDAVLYAKEYAKEVSQKFSLPIYLFSEAAAKTDRQELDELRKDQLEGFARKITEDDWEPDMGPRKFLEKHGACAVGARRPYLTIDIELDTDDEMVARSISEDVRESGSIIRDENGQPVNDEQGEIKRIPGSLKAVRGLHLKEGDRTFVSLNLMDTSKTSIHQAVEEVKRKADILEVGLKSVHIDGLMTWDMLVEQGRYYRDKSKDKGELEEEDLVSLALESMAVREGQSRLIETLVDMVLEMPKDEWEKILEKEFPIPGPVGDSQKSSSGEKPGPETAKPETAKPETAKPETAKPETAKPETAKPETAKPETAKPEISKPPLKEEAVEMPKAVAVDAEDGAGQTEPVEPVKIEPEPELNADALRKDLEGMLKKELKQLCREGGLKISGNKADLVDRIMEASGSVDSDPDDNSDLDMSGLEIGGGETKGGSSRENKSEVQEREELEEGLEKEISDDPVIDDKGSGEVGAEEEEAEEEEAEDVEAEKEEAEKEEAEKEEAEKEEAEKEEAEKEEAEKEEAEKEEAEEEEAEKEEAEEEEAEEEEAEEEEAEEEEAEEEEVEWEEAEKGGKGGRGSRKRGKKSGRGKKGSRRNRKR